jgi:hypothetical protein
MDDRNAKLVNTLQALLLARGFFLILASLFGLYGSSLYVSKSYVLMAFVGAAALIALIISLLPTKTLDRVLDSVPPLFW